MKRQISKNNSGKLLLSLSRNVATHLFNIMARFKICSSYKDFIFCRRLKSNKDESVKRPIQ